MCYLFNLSLFSFSLLTCRNYIDQSWLFKRGTFSIYSDITNFHMIGLTGELNTDLVIDSSSLYFTIAVKPFL